MFYAFDIVVPANTLESAPVETELKLTSGIVNHVEIEYLYGAANMVFLRVIQGGHQLWPTNPDRAFHGDGRVIAWQEDYELTPDQNILKAIAYSPGTTYDHTVTVRINVLPAESVSPLAGMAAQLKQFLRLMGVK